MNEIIFFIHIFVLLGFLIFCLKLGKKALFVYITLQAIFANLFVIKQIELFGFIVTCSDVYAISAVFGLNLLQEYFGKNEAKKAFKISFVCILLFMIVSKINLLYIPAFVDKTQNSFITIFSNTPRIIISSFIVFFLVQRFDIAFYGLLRKKINSSLILRLFISSLVSQAIDTVLFSFLGLYGIVDNILDVILLSFFIKMIAIFSSGIFILFTKKVFNLRSENELS